MPILKQDWHSRGDQRVGGSELKNTNFTKHLKALSSASQIVGEDEVDTRLLRDLFHRAESYLTSFKWCPAIAESFFGYGVGGIIGVFLFKLSSKINGLDDMLWVVVGDIPSAYLVTEGNPDPASAMGAYCELMDDWAKAVLNGDSLEDKFPVSAPATFENANQLLSRTKFIREELIPNCIGK